MFDKDLLQYEEKAYGLSVKYNNTILAINVSSVRVPFGIKELIYDNSKNYNLQISIDNKNDKLNNLLKFIIELENHAKERIVKNIKLQNKKFISRIYYGNNSPLVKLDLKEDTLIMDKNNNKLSLESFLNKSLIADISFSYLSIYNNKNVELSFKIKSLIIGETKTKIDTITSFNF